MRRTNRRANPPGRSLPSAARARFRPKGHGRPRLRPLLHRSPGQRPQDGAEGGAQTGRSRTSAPPAQEKVREITTIVEYSATKRPANNYPKRIVSPLRPRTCCVTGMEPLGKPRREAGWFYVYKRCDTCGFTVRSIVRRDPAAVKMPVRASFN